MRSCAANAYLLALQTGQAGQAGLLQLDPAAMPMLPTHQHRHAFNPDSCFLQPVLVCRHHRHDSRIMWQSPACPVRNARRFVLAAQLVKMRCHWLTKHDICSLEKVLCEQLQYKLLSEVFAASSSVFGE